MKSQKARSAERKRMDKLDFEACMEREDWTCQVCGAEATQMHHGKRKHLHVRHDPRWHYALCYTCHDLAHKRVADWDYWMEYHPNS